MSEALAVGILRQDEHVDHSDDARIHEPDQLLRHLSREIRLTGWKLDHVEIDGAELTQILSRHVG